MRAVPGDGVKARLSHELRWRLRRANTALLVAGVACLFSAVAGTTVSLGGVSAPGLASGWAQLLLAALGAGLIGLSLVVVGPEPLPPHPGAPTPSGFLGAAPLRTARFVPRPELDRLVEALVQADGRTVALVGMGGAGKTVLAAAAANERRVKRRFPDGVAWLVADPRADVPALQSELAGRLGGSSPPFTDVREGRDALAGLLAGRAVLVVLDNVWERAVLDGFPPECQLLITSRHDLARDVDAVAVEVAELSLEGALALLGRWTDRDQRELDAVPADEICVRLDRLALGVAMAGAMIGPRAPAERWKDVLGRLEAADLGKIRADFGEEYPHPTLLAAIALGIDELPDEATRERYRKLAVFSGRGPFPRAAAEALWAPAGLAGPDAGDLLDVLERRSLIQLAGEGRYTLHDLQSDVVAHQLGADGLSAAHAQLVTGYRTRVPAGWASAPEEDYLLANLAYHLARAGRSDELRELLTDYAWLDTKLRHVGLASLLADYPHLPEDPAAKAVHASLQLAAHILPDDPDQLPGQLVGRLGDDADPALRRLLDEASASADAPWLCPTTPALTSPGGPLRQTLLHPYEVSAVAVSPDGRHVVSGSGDTVRVWELASGRQVGAPLTGHTEAVYAVAVTPDGRHVVSGGEDGVRVWSVASGRQLGAPLTGHSDSVSAVAVTPDGRRVVSGGGDGTVWVWELASGRQLGAPLTGHEGSVRTVAVSPDGRHAVSGGLDRTVRVWELASASEVVRWSADYEVIACAMGPGLPLTVAVGESGGSVYALELRGLPRLDDSREETTAQKRTHSSMIR